MATINPTLKDCIAKVDPEVRDEVRRNMKSIEERATIAAIEDTSKGRNRTDYFISAMADHENGFREGFIKGAEYGYKEAIKMAKEWIQKNVPIIYTEEGDYVRANIGHKSVPMNKYLADFEADINKLLEERI